MAIEVKCEACGRTFKVNDELAGRRVRCSACSATLTVPGAGGAHGAGPSECPDCGNPLPAGAVLCVGCGYNLTTGTRAQMRKAPRTRRGLPKFTISLPGWVRTLISLAVVWLVVWFVIFQPLWLRFGAYKAFGVVARGEISAGLAELKEMKQKRLCWGYAKRLDVLISQAEWLAELEETEAVEEAPPTVSSSGITMAAHEAPNEAKYSASQVGGSRLKGRGRAGGYRTLGRVGSSHR